MFVSLLVCQVSRANGEGSNPYLVGIDGSIERIHSLLTDAKRVAGTDVLPLVSYYTVLIYTAYVAFVYKLVFSSLTRLQC